MQKILFLFLLSTLTSCLNTDELNLDKFNEFVIEPELLLPFVQINFSNKFYQQILDSTHDSDSTDMEVDVFKDLDLSDNVDSIEFNFTVINGYPIKFDEISIIFMDINKLTIEKITLENIYTNSPSPPTPQDFHHTFGPPEISKIMATRGIRVIISWKGNKKPYPPNDDLFYFKLNSDLVLKTNIDVGK